jgi:hypothetical protein
MNHHSRSIRFGEYDGKSGHRHFLFSSRPLNAMPSHPGAPWQTRRIASSIRMLWSKQLPGKRLSLGHAEYFGRPSPGLGMGTCFFGPLGGAIRYAVPDAGEPGAAHGTVRTTRNPTALYTVVGTLLKRVAQRTNFDGESNEPPRTLRLTAD